MEESYLIFLLEPYEYSYKKALKLPRKIYLIDTSFCMLYDFSRNYGRKLENIVFIELLRRFGRENIFYYYSPEIDFVVKDGLKIKYLIQVCYELNEKNFDREINNLLKVSEKLNCNNLYVITYDQEDEINGVKVIPCWKFLLRNNI
jgi:predicted AAA+ superfamily ATPase